MPSIDHNNRTFDARPDRVDLRDRQYQPILKSLPQSYPDSNLIQEYLPAYAKHFVLDQGSEGACTGFGLAAVINYLQWQKNGYAVDDLVTISPRMLYHMARIYDEWPGEDYDGSSCRGAMKGWHRHGVCSKAYWPYRNRAGRIAFVKPQQGWQQDAAAKPLGAYYRLNKDSISDIQAAIFEVGAVYASATVHEGWFMDVTSQPELIPFSQKSTGGHAFAFVGYTQDGFIIQNSWGPGWGYQGFALLGYEDWVQNGNDAWVAVLGAPMKISSTARTFSQSSLTDVASGKAGLFGRQGRAGSGFKYKNSKVKPYAQDKAYLHSVVLGNNGRPINKILDVEDSQAAVKEVCYNRPKQHFGKLPANSNRRLAIYVHGGLNNEKASIQRIQTMAPYFVENDIYPLFITWKTGLLESLGGILQDAIRNIFKAMPETRDEGVVDAIREKLREARDRSIEVASENLLVKPLWSEMKQNAEAAASVNGGIHLLAGHLISLAKDEPGLQVHLIGHSAGSLVLGHLLTVLKKNLPIGSLSLFAPACGVDFANKHYIKAVKNGILTPSDIHVDILDDERERADSVGPYGKSLLYLVSRALEVKHKLPLLGMQWAWSPDKAPQDVWSSDRDVKKALKDWNEFHTGGVKHRLHGKKREYVSTGADQINLSHSSFDNDVEVFSALLRRIKGGSLNAEVENLKY